MTTTSSFYLKNWCLTIVFFLLFFSGPIVVQCVFLVIWLQIAIQPPTFFLSQCLCVSWWYVTHWWGKCKEPLRDLNTRLCVWVEPDLRPRFRLSRPSLSPHSRPPVVFVLAQKLLWADAGANFGHIWYTSLSPALQHPQLGEVCEPWDLSRMELPGFLLLMSIRPCFGSLVGQEKPLRTFISLRRDPNSTGR